MWRRLALPLGIGGLIVCAVLVATSVPAQAPASRRPSPQRTPFRPRLPASRSPPAGSWPRHRLSQQRPGHPRGGRAGRARHRRAGRHAAAAADGQQLALHRRQPRAFACSTTRFRTRPHPGRHPRGRPQAAGRAASNCSSREGKDRGRHPGDPGQPEACSPRWRTSRHVPTMHAADKAALNSESAIALSKYVMEQRVEKREGAGRAAAGDADAIRKGSSSPSRKLNELTSGT